MNAFSMESSLLACTMRKLQKALTNPLGPALLQCITWTFRDTGFAWSTSTCGLTGRLEVEANVDQPENADPRTGEIRHRPSDASRALTCLGDSLSIILGGDGAAEQAVVGLDVTVDREMTGET